MTCLNNMRNVGLSVLNWSTSNNGAMPPLVGGIDYYTVAGGVATPVPAPWTVHLLPYLDQAGLYDRITNSSTSTAVIQDLTSDNIVNIKVLTCPDDQTADDAGACSFVANAGYIGTSLFTSASSNTTHRVQYVGSGTAAAPQYYQWTVTGKTADAAEWAKRTLSTGVFWRQDSVGTQALVNAGTIAALNPTNLKMTIDKMRDGTSQTLMLTENITAGGWLPTPQGTAPNYLGAATGDVAFGLAVTDTTAGTPDYVLDQGTTGGVGTKGFTLDSATEKSSRINSNLTAATGTLPRPASLHPQIVNVILCDGSGRTLNQSINDSVYARLLSPNGNNYNQAIVDGNSY
jgi:hypothetical protein